MSPGLRPPPLLRPKGHPTRQRVPQAGNVASATRSRRLRATAERSGKGGAPDRRFKTLWRRSGAPPFPQERPSEATFAAYNRPMSSPSSVAESPITDRRELVEYIAGGERVRADWRIGTE